MIEVKIMWINNNINMSKWFLLEYFTIGYQIYYKILNY